MTKDTLRKFISFQINPARISLFLIIFISLLFFNSIAHAALVSHWTFDEASGSSAIDTAGNDNGNIINATPNVGGKIGTAYNFDGNGDYVDFGAGPQILGTGAFSVSAWFKTSSTASEQYIISQRGPDYDGEYVLQMISSGQLEWFIYGGGFNFYITSNTNLTNDGNWHHVVALREADGTGRIYIDGVLDSSESGTSRNLINLNVYVGGDLLDNNKFFNGEIDDVRIYDQALAAAEVTALYNITPPTNAAPVVTLPATASVTMPNTLPIDATIQDDNLPTSATLTWSVVSPANSPHVSFSNINVEDPVVTITQVGTYVLRLTADDTEYSHSDDITVTVSETTNSAPVVTLPATASVTLPNTLAIDAAVQDDNIPTAATLTWSVVSPANSPHVSFSNINVEDPVVTINQAGAYVLRLTADDTVSSPF